MIPLKDLTEELLRAAVDLVMGTPAFRENARRMQKVIGETEGLNKAATIIEQAFGVVAANSSTMR